MAKLKHLLLLAAISTAFVSSAFEVRYTKPVKALVTVSTVGGEYVVSGLLEHETRFSAAVNRERERKYIRLLAENSLMRFLKEEGVAGISFSGASISSNRTSVSLDEKISFKYVIPKANCKKVYKSDLTATGATAEKAPAPTATAPTAAAAEKAPAPTATAPAAAAAEKAPAPTATAPTAAAAEKAPAPSETAPAAAAAEKAPAPSTAQQSADRADNSAATQETSDDEVDAVQFEIASPDVIFDSSWRITADKEADIRNHFDKLIQDFERRK